MNSFGPGAKPISQSNDHFALPPTRFLDHTYPDLASNLALDEALLLDAADDPQAGPLLRFWEPTRLAVVLGASGRLRDDVNADLCRAEGVEIGRRSSGGGTVLIGPGTLNVTLILRCDAKPEFKHVDTAQRAVLETIAEALRGIGRDVRVEGSGDLTLEGRKFSGSAQRRIRDWFLIHATILNSAPIAPIVRYTKAPARQPAYRAGRPHERFLTRLDLPPESLAEAIRRSWNVTGLSTSLPTSIDRAVREMVAARFGHSDWIERL